MSEGIKQTKKRRISEKDWSGVAEFVKTELKRRETDKFRVKHERIWKEVDRQVAMEPMEARKKDSKDQGDWHNVIELGELARAQEIITADIMRLTFPTNREWFEAHSELPPQFNEVTGENQPDKDIQKFVDGAVRAFMAQQQTDFGFKERINLSVHECLAHGSFVVEVDEETVLKIHDGSGIQSMSAPVWKPHSMWNCFPDPSPSSLGTNTFYSGSMIIREYIPMYQLRELAQGDGWMASQIPKVRKRTNKNKEVETEDVELVKYFGDIVIKRQDGDVILPNSEAYLANDTIVYWSASKLPVPRVIFNGYERMDIRDPYYVSPLIKTSPMHKMATKLANKLLDNVDLHVEPPIVYDGNDPNFVRNGGPVIAPGMKTPTRSLANYKEITIGDPSVGLQSLSFVLDQIRQSTSVDAIRAGAGDTADKTATQIRNESRRGEVRVVDFVDKLEFSLKTFLYMQHEFNKKGMSKYSFYNPEMDSPDFMWMTKGDLPKNIHFEVVGAKGILGEEDRANKMMGVTMMASQSELFAPLLRPEVILKEAYMDAGVKNPERLIKFPNDELSMIVEQLQQQAQEVISQYEEKIMELEKQLAIRTAVNDARVTEASIKAQVQAGVTNFKTDLEAQLKILETQLELVTKANEQLNNQDTNIQGVTEAIQEIIETVNEQFSKVEEKTNALEQKGSDMDNQLKGLLEKANEPIEDKIGRLLPIIRKLRGE